MKRKEKSQEAKLEQLSKGFLRLATEHQDYILAIEQALVFAKKNTENSHSKNDKITGCR